MTRINVYSQSNYSVETNPNKLLYYFGIHFGFFETFFVGSNIGKSFSVLQKKSHLLGKIFLGKSGYSSKENDTHFQYKHANVDGKIDNSLPTVLHKHIGAYIRMHSSAYKWIECNSKSDVLYSKCISDGSGTRNLGFGF